MKKVVLLLVALAFSLVSNAQNLGDGVYGQVALNAKQIIGQGNAAVQCKLGLVSSGVDLNIAVETISSFNEPVISTGIAGVITLHEAGAFLNFGGIVGISTGEASDFFYSPDVTLRLHPNNSDTISIIFQGTLPQTNVNSSDKFNWNDPVFRAGLRINF